MKRVLSIVVMLGLLVLVPLSLLADAEHEPPIIPEVDGLGIPFLVMYGKAGGLTHIDLGLFNDGTVLRGKYNYTPQTPVERVEVRYSLGWIPADQVEAIKTEIEGSGVIENPGRNAYSKTRVSFSTRHVITYHNGIDHVNLASYHKTYEHFGSQYFVSSTGPMIIDPEDHAVMLEREPEEFQQFRRSWDFFETVLAGVDEMAEGTYVELEDRLRVRRRFRAVPTGLETPVERQEVEDSEAASTEPEPQPE